MALSQTLEIQQYLATFTHSFRCPLELVKANIKVYHCGLQLDSIWIKIPRNGLCMHKTTIFPFNIFTISKTSFLPHFTWLTQKPSLNKHAKVKLIILPCLANKHNSILTNKFLTKYTLSDNLLIVFIVSWHSFSSKVLFFKQLVKLPVCSQLLAHFT